MKRPVIRRRRGGGALRVVLVGVAALVVGGGCGYHAAFGGAAPAYRLAVVGAPLGVPHPDVLQAALAGARAELGLNGVLAPGTSVFPRFVVEVLRVDEVASGIVAADAPGGALPLGRASAVGVTVRGWVEERAGGPPVRETGDVRRVETVAQGSDPLAGTLAVDQAARAAGRLSGEAAARRALGIAEPAVEPM